MSKQSLTRIIRNLKPDISTAIEFATPPETAAFQKGFKQALQRLSEVIAPVNEKAADERRAQFVSELSKAINMYSKENVSGTPDFILAEFLAGCLQAFDTAVAARTHWHGSGALAASNTSADINGDLSVIEDVADAERYGGLLICTKNMKWFVHAVASTDHVTWVKAKDRAHAQEFEPSTILNTLSTLNGVTGKKLVDVNPEEVESEVSVETFAPTYASNKLKARGSEHLVIRTENEKWYIYSIYETYVVWVQAEARAHAQQFPAGSLLQTLEQLEKGGHRKLEAVGLHALKD